MASKENKEREHPGDKKTGVKLIYQGQEKKVIIVSTIQSSLEYVSMGSQNKLGFLFNSKRFNLGIKKGERTIYVKERTDPRLKDRTRRHVDKSDPILGDREEFAANEGKGKNVTREM